jgi:hypothetical protein
LPLAVFLSSVSALFFFLPLSFLDFLSFHFLLSFCWIHLICPVSRWTLNTDLADPSASDMFPHLWRLPFLSNHVFGTVRGCSVSYGLLYVA